MKKAITLGTLTPVLLATLVACSTSKDTFTTAKGAALHQAADCGDLLEQIQADAIAKLDQQVALYKKHGIEADSGDLDIAIGGWAEDDFGGDGDGGLIFEDAAPSAEPVDATSGGSVTMGSGESGADNNANVSRPDSFSKTNTQVLEVDEADIVKIAADGERIVVLHGSALKIVDAWPAESMTELGSESVSGEAFELFVHEGVATVFSTVYPSDLPGTESKNPYGDSAPEGYCSYGDTSFTQVSIFDVSGDAPQLQREMIFEGNYVSSRRHGDMVRAIVRGGFAATDLYYPDIDAYDSFGREKSKERITEDLDRWRDQVAADIEDTTLSDWIPQRYEKDGDTWDALSPECGSYFVPEPGLVEGGVTQVVTFEPGAGEAPQVTAVLGGAETVYANHTSLYVGQADWRFLTFGEGDGQRTSLHKFVLDGKSSHYTASGFVPGLPLNQFALDERDDVLRMTTTDREDWNEDPKNRIFTVGEKEGALVELDRSENLGKPGETIFSTRFVGDRAYVVTFENTDPLYVADLSDPENIEILGSLEIPGFSDYMHPMGQTHLLTIGQDADEDGGLSGVALQIFDVSEPTNPQLTHKETYGGFSYSEANRNHKAFTFVDDYFGDGEDLLLFPLVTYEPDYRAGLEVVKVSKSSGFEKIGTIDHAALLNDCPGFLEEGYPCNHYWGDEMRRGMQIDDFIYALSQRGLTAHEVVKGEGATTLSEAVSTLDLGQPEYNSCEWYWEEGFGDIDWGGEPIPVDVVEPGVVRPPESGEVPPASMGGASGL